MTIIEAGAPRLDFVHGLDAFDALGEDWNAILERSPTPFLTGAWLRSWWEAFGRGRPTLVTLRAGDQLLGGALLELVPGGLRAPANVHTGDWDVLAVDDATRTTLWQTIARHDGARVSVAGLLGESTSASIAVAALHGAGYHTVVERDLASPFARLPTEWDQLLAARSSNLRGQWRRRSRALAGQGRVTFRVSTSGRGADRDFAALLRLEAAGWKGREGTAIANDPRTVMLYRSFAAAAARDGTLRIYVLELDGEPLAIDLGCRIGDVGFLVKTSFDEGAARLSPGLVLRGEVLRASIEEGMTGYDFLGGPDEYKLRWTDELRVRTTIEARRGLRGAAFAAYRMRLRPALGRGRRLLQGRVPR